MSCEKCDGTGWIIVDTPKGSAAKPCACRPVRKPEPPKGKPLTEKEAIAALTLLCGTLGWPPEAGARGLIVKAMMTMCSTKEQAMWMVERAAELYTRWPDCGIRGLRQILSSDLRYLPADGVTISCTEAYPEGIPSTRKDPEPLQLALPPGHVASADLEMDESIQRLAQVKSIDRPAPVPNPNFKPITQADIDRVREERMLQRAREEREPEAS